MASMLQKRMTLRRKIHILRAHSSSKSVMPNQRLRSFLCLTYKQISFKVVHFSQTFRAHTDFLLPLKLKLKLEAIKREYSAMIRQYLKLMKRMQVPNKDVEVHKVGQGFLVRVNCEKGTDRLVTILEAFDEMGLNVQQAKVSCSNCFALEAIAVAEDQALDVKEVIKALLRTTEKKGGGPTH